MLSLVLFWLLAHVGLITKVALAQATEPVVEENTLGLKLVKIPAGEFLMGSDETTESLAKTFEQYEKRRFQLADEAPVHKVRITKSFWLGQTEITRGQFRKYLELSQHKPDSITDGTGGWGYDSQKKEFVGRKPIYSWEHPGFEQDDTHPVVNVTWHDAVRFCEWLSTKEGKKYRLPTEAEWEYACRAGTRTRYHGGDAPETLLKIANTFDQETAENFPQWKQFATPGKDGFRFTSPVGKFAPNAFGLHDMHGGVWEWCSDWYAEDYYAKSPEADPTGPETGRLKVRRGGSWHTWPLYARASFRNWNTPATRYVLVGFRVVREE
jgi:formylglycine-generating enzyme required for sulfatase activity